MNWKRVAILSLMGGTLVTLLARASTSIAPATASAPTISPPPSPSAPIFPEVERLRARLRSPIAPAAPPRNLFSFEGADRRPAPVAPTNSLGAVTSSPTAPAPAAVRTPGMTFVGLAEEPGADGPIRTAILSGGRDLYIASAGDVVGAYRVSAIGSDALELVALDDGASFVLTLK